MSKHYLSIVDLPLNRFIDCIVDDNIYSLVISGKPTDEDLAMAWNNIRIQYADAMKDGDYIQFAKLSREIFQLERLQDLIIMAVRELRDYYTVQFHHALNDLLSYKFILDPFKPEEYDKTLQNALNRSKGYMIELSLKRAAMDSMILKMSSKGDRMTREYFQQVLITLSDHSEYRLKADDMTVFEYCDRVRRMNEYIKSIQVKTKPHGRK